MKTALAIRVRYIHSYIYIQCYVIRWCTNCVWIFQYVLLYVLEHTHTRASTYANPLQPSFSWAHPGWVSYGCNSTSLHWGQIFEEGDPAPKTWYHQAMHSKWIRCEKETTPIEADEPEPTRVLLLIHVESYPICVQPIYSHLNIYSRRNSHLKVGCLRYCERVCLDQGHHLTAEAHTWIPMPSSWIHMLTHGQVLMPELAAAPIPAGMLRLIWCLLVTLMFGFLWCALIVWKHTMFA